MKIDKVKEWIKNNYLMVLAIILRVIYGLKSTPLNCQHDVMDEFGHFDYAKCIFRSLKLPITNAGEYYHPPLNAILQGLFMRLNSLFINPKSNVLARLKEYQSALPIIGIEKNVGLNNYLLSLYSRCNVLSIIYSIVTIIVIYKILGCFELKDKIKKIIFAIIAFYPGLIIEAGQYNNDGITLMFFFLALYVAILWCKDKKFVTIIVLAFVVGLSLLCRISNAVLALIIGPMMLIILVLTIQKGDINKTRDLIIQYIVFALIAFPIGLSYVFRNMVLFGQSITYVPEISKGTILEIVNHGIFDRFLSLPLNRLFNGPFGIYHDVREYNIWVDLIKSAAYQEFIYSDSYCNIPCHILIIWNFIFSIISVFSFVLCLVLKIRGKYKENRDITNISIIMIIISIISFVVFNFNFPYSCTSNYRYIAYATFAYATITTLMIVYFNNNLINKIFRIFVMIFVFASTIFVLAF